MMTSRRVRDAGGGSFASRRGHANQLSISDTSHHITETIGTMYGDDDDYQTNEPRPLSFIAAPRGGEQLSDRGELGLSSADEHRLRLVRSASSETGSLNGNSPSTPQTQPAPMQGRGGLSRTNSNGSPTSPISSGGPMSPTLRDMRDTSDSYPLTNIDNPNDIAQELSNLQALRRLSMDVSNNSDPDLLPFQAMSLVAMPSIAPRGDDDADPSRLLWVPAGVHPELAPSEFKNFVEKRVQSMKRRSSETSLSPDGLDRSDSGGLRRKKSMLSRQVVNGSGHGADGYVDGAERLERKRSQGQSEYSVPELSLDELMKDPSKAVRKLTLDSQGGDDSSILDDMPILHVAPGSASRTDTLTFIPTFSSSEEKKPEKRNKKDSSEGGSSKSSSWKWFKSDDKEKRKKEEEARKSKTKAFAEKAHDNVRLDVLQNSIDTALHKGRESLLLDRDSIDSKLEEERRKENSRKSGEQKKEKDGLFSSFFSSSKKKGDRDSSNRKSHLQRPLSPEPAPYRPLRPDVDYHWTRFPILEERAIYRMAHIKLANPRRALYSQVLLSNFMYAYLAKVQAMHPQIQVPQSPQQKRLQEEERKRREQEQQYLEQQHAQDSIDRYNFEYHRVSSVSVPLHYLMLTHTREQTSTRIQACSTKQAITLKQLRSTTTIMARRTFKTGTTGTTTVEPRTITLTSIRMGSGMTRRRRCGNLYGIRRVLMKAPSCLYTWLASASTGVTEKGNHAFWRVSYHQPQRRGIYYPFKGLFFSFLFFSFFSFAQLAWWSFSQSFECRLAGIESMTQNLNSNKARRRKNKFEKNRLVNTASHVRPNAEVSI
ncbi:hypothetical protein F4823DRAFT_541486 [Ustulina deusta]|nr:hypothetical protein F4823DRAFT_541486 [Ustulina deusta]